MQDVFTAIGVPREEAAVSANVLITSDRRGIVRRCMQMAIDKARDNGLGMVTVRNSTHYGICGYYLMMAAEAGMVGITGTNARPSIAPTGEKEHLAGLEVAAFGVPVNANLRKEIDQMRKECALDGYLFPWDD